MQDNLTVKDAVRFLLEEPRKVLKDWNVRDIYRYISRAIQEGAFYWTRDTVTNRLCFVVVGHIDRRENIFHVCAIKSTQAGLLRIYLREFRRRFPQLTLTAYRQGKFKNYG